MCIRDRLNYGKTGLVIVKPTFGGEQIEIQARLSFRKDDNDPVSYTHLDVYKRQFYRNGES